MKLKVFLSLCAMTLAGLVMAAEKVVTMGAELGQWTMDVQAAKDLAKKADKPIFMNFTGSDWCGWCQLMDRSVFSQEAWQAYAKENLVLLWIDFPKNKALIPEGMLERNRELAQQYDVSGYPTYVVLASDGEKVLGQLGAETECTPQKFIAKLERTLQVARLDQVLSKEDYAEWLALEKEMEEFAAKITAWQKKLTQEGKAFQVEQKSLEERREAILKKAFPAE